MQGKFNWGRVLLSGASLAALGAGTSYAQDNSEVSDEIIVTATGRAAAIQDVPIAVTAVSSEAVENAGVHDIRDLEQLAPSYRFFTGQSNTAGTNAIIRGLGTGGDNPGFEAAVGVFIDGVYRSRAGTALADLPEVDRIEVLRGPQGTLFGRNTSAGALSIITAGPEFETHAWMEGTAGDYGLAEAKAGFTAPVVQDTLAVRLDVSGRARDGYIDDLRSGNTLNTRDRWNARAQALWDITPDATLRIIVDGGQTNENCCYAVTRQRNDTGLVVNAILAGLAGAPATPGAVGILPGNISTGNALAFAPNALGDYKARDASVTPGREPTEAIQEWGASGQLDWDLGGVQFTSITGYRDWDSQRSQDIDFSDLDRAYRDGLGIRFRTATQEFRFHGEFGRLDWLAGAYIGHEELDQTDRIRVGNDAGIYVDALVANLAGAQLHGTYPMTFADIVGGTPGALPNIVGAGYVQQAASTLAGAALTAPQAFGYLATHPGAASTAVINTYNGIASAFQAAYPLDGMGQQSDYWNQVTDSYALFTHDEISLTDNLVWTIGVRFNHETKDYTAELNAVYPTCQVEQSASISPIIQGIIAASPAAAQIFLLGCNPVLNTAANGAHANSRSEDEWTGTTSLAYHITPDLLAYAGYSRGYKSGGYNLDRSGFGSLLPWLSTPPSDSEPHFDPEFVDSYEGGVKSTLLGGTATLNVTGFYEKIQDFQTNAFSGFNFITFNAPELISQGVEVEGGAHITDHLSFTGGVTWNDATYDKDAFSPSTGELLVPKGTTLAYASKWVSTAAVTYRQPISDDLEALFYIDARYNSSAPTATLARNPLKDNAAYAIVDGRISLGSPEGRWSVEVWGRNLTDETYFIGSFTVPEQDNIAVYPNEPRTWGVTLKARY
jgi:iron complex outermembrane recepter protein